MSRIFFFTSYKRHEKVTFKKKRKEKIKKKKENLEIETFLFSLKISHLP